MTLPEPPMRRRKMDAPSRRPAERIPMGAMIAVAAVLLVGLVAATTVPFAVGWVGQDDLEALGYPGVFLANFLGSATLFFPVPGLTAAGQALIVAGSERLWTLGVVIAGASGMTLAESTAYLAGRVGRRVAEQRRSPMKGRLGEWIRRGSASVDRLMASHGFLTLLVLSGVPNPLFEFAGITAGATRMNPGRFLLAVGVGKTTRVIILMIVGQAFLDLF